MTEPADEFFGLLAEAENAAQDNLLDDPQEVLRAQCGQWAQSAVELRFTDVPDIFPGTEASPHEVAAALVRCRARLDAVEVLLGNTMTLKASTATRARELEQAADDAWDRQAGEERDSRRPRPEWQGPKERYAYWNLAIRDERARAREARWLADYVKDGYERVKLCYDGLNETRRDLVSRLAHFRWESNMEM